MHDEWKFAQLEPAQRLARLHYFAIESRGASFRITVHEYVTPPDPAMPFFAQADRPANQHSAPYTPCGWGRTLLEALAECARAIDRFPCDEVRAAEPARPA